jgi:hypothetical protein
MRESEAKLQESEGRNGLENMNTRKQRFLLFQGKTSIPRKQIYREIIYSYSKWSIRKIVTMAWIHMAA